MARALENAPLDLESTPYSTVPWIELDREVCERGACTRPDRRPRRRNGKYHDPWYPDEPRVGAERAAQAREACLGCPVTSACLERQLRLEAETGVVYGIAGSVSQKRRRAILVRTGWIWPLVSTNETDTDADTAEVNDEVA